VPKLCISFARIEYGQNLSELENSGTWNKFGQILSVVVVQKGITNRKNLQGALHSQSFPTGTHWNRAAKYLLSGIQVFIVKSSKF